MTASRRYQNETRGPRPFARVHGAHAQLKPLTIAQVLNAAEWRNASAVPSGLRSRGATVPNVLKHWAIVVHPSGMKNLILEFRDRITPHSRYHLLSRRIQNLSL